MNAEKQPKKRDDGVQAGGLESRGARSDQDALLAEIREISSQMMERLEQSRILIGDLKRRLHGRCAEGPRDA